MKKVIIYASKYGSAKEYAKEYGRTRVIKTFDYKKIKNKQLDEYDTIIYFGGIYEEKVLGLDKTLKKISNAKSKNIIVVTVGIGNPYIEETKNAIKERILKKLPKDLNLKIYNLRGTINYNKLNIFDKVLMFVFNKILLLTKEEKRSLEIKDMIESYGKNANYIDFSKLDGIDIL